LGAEDGNCNGCILQAGYMKYASGDQPTNCPSGSTGGVVKFEYMISQSNTHTCFLGIGINEGDTYSFKIIHGPVGDGSQCDGSHWCIYFHGDFAHQYSPGLDATADDVENVGEFSCGSCMTSSTAMRVNYGATSSSSGLNWEADEQTAGGGFSVFTIHASDVTSILGGGTCSPSSNSGWVRNVVTVNSRWDIYWKNGGTAC
jgi:hypothetical protein